MKRAFAGLVPAIWLERYAGDRIEALKEELHELERVEPPLTSLH